MPRFLRESADGLKGVGDWGFEVWLDLSPVGEKVWRVSIVEGDNKTV